VLAQPERVLSPAITMAPSSTEPIRWKMVGDEWDGCEAMEPK